MNEFDFICQQTIEDLRLITRKLCNNPQKSLIVKEWDFNNEVKYGKVDLTKERVQRIISTLKNIKDACKE